MKTGKKTLALSLIFAFIAAFCLGISAPALADEIDAFGIRMSDWTETEKAKARGEAPFGSGSAKTSILTKSELYVSLVESNAAWRRGAMNWNVDANGKEKGILVGTNDSTQGTLLYNVRNWNKNGLLNWN